LAASDITVTGATKGALSGTGTSRSLAISAITVANGANVTVALANPAGFTITPASKTVAVNVATVPAAPTGLTAVADPILAKVVLTWTPPSGTITGYKVYFGISSGTETLDRTLTGSPITCTETYSFGGSTGSFYYKVSAVNAVGEGPLSGEAIATTAVPPKPNLYGYSNSGEGTGFDASSIYVYSTTLSNYDTNDTGAVEFTMTDPYSYAAVKTTQFSGLYFHYIYGYASQTQAEHTMIRGSTTSTTNFSFVVRVKNGWGWSALSDPCIVTLPISFAAVDVTSIAVGSRSLTPSWARTSTDPNASIRLICIDNTTGAVTNANWWDDYTKTSATVSGLTPGDTYRFIVQTYNHLSQNGASSEQIFFDNAAVPHTVSGLWVGMPLTYATPNP
jgi:titin